MYYNTDRYIQHCWGKLTCTITQADIYNIAGVSLHVL